MEESLLAHLYSRIKGSQEDVATMSLQYIISSSDEINAAFNQLLGRSLDMQLDPSIHYSCQSVGKNKERPDMSGKDKEGHEIVLCEMKFYAGLTDNQPNGYLERLIAEDGKALVFVCPSRRRVSLWDKIILLCEEKQRTIEIIGEYASVVDGIRMSVLSWEEVIEEIRRASTTSSIDMRHDIAQLDGFCKLMDQESFIPFSSEELSPDTPRKENRYYQVVDGVINHLSARKDISTSLKGVRANPYWDGYSRAIKINDFWCEISYHRKLWMQSQAETPFWFLVRNSEWKQSEDMVQELNKLPNKEKASLYGWCALALYPPVNAPEDDVIEDLIEQMLKYLSLFST